MSRFWGLFSAVVVAGLVGAGLPLLMVAPAQAAEPGAPRTEQRTPGQTVTADPLPTVQLDGASAVVWAQDISGDTVYAGGAFANVKPAGAANGTNLTPRSNLLAYSISTGQLVDAWAPSVNGTVRSIDVSPDGSRVYVGGSFTVANGAARYLFAAFDATTGALVSGFSPSVGGAAVYAIQATADTVYVGGSFTQANGVARKNLAAFSTSNGALLGWAPTTDLQVDTMVLDPAGGNLIVGGRFGVVNGASARGLASLDRANGSLLPWITNDIVQNGVPASSSTAGRAGISTLTTDGNAVYGTGWVYSGVTTGNLEGAFSAAPGTGALNWLADCHGDHYGIWSDGSTVYTTSHVHSCETVGGMRNGATNQGNMRHSSALTAAVKGTLPRTENVSDIYKDWSGYPSPNYLYWTPEWLVGSVMGQAGWSITGNSEYIAIGGEFLGVNNLPFRGLVRFAKNPAGGKKQRPRLSGSTWKATATAPTNGTAVVSVPTNYDRDDLDLTYRFYRSGSSTPFATVPRKSVYWQPSVVRAVDRNLTPGTSYTYYVVASDADGNQNSSDPVTITATSGPALSTYAQTIVGDGPDVYWRLGNGNTVDDTMGRNPGYAAGLGTSNGAIVGESDRSGAFASSDRLATTTAAALPTETSTEMWIKTDTTRGGLLASFGNQRSTNSTTYDHSLYMGNNGSLNYALYFSGRWQVLTTPQSFNDDTWHHVVVTNDITGSRIFVDGVERAFDGSMKYGRNYTSGYWRVGNDAIATGIVNRPTSTAFTGSIDEFAAYPFALTSQQIIGHRDAGLNVTPPVAAFTSSTSDLNVAFDSSSSSSSPGRSLTGYAWDFGDGSTSTAASPEHAFAQAGTYTVKLTVTDNAGSTGTTTRQVEVTAPHVPPTATIGQTVSGLSVDFDGTGSTSANGSTIASYAWDFGDGTTSTQAKPRHAYAAAGTYDATLTVTDSLGFVSQAATSTVTVVHADPSASFVATATGLTAQFDASASSASDAATMTYAWDFGDGATGTGVSPTHRFEEAGTYTVKLTVTDSFGATASTSRETSITEFEQVAVDGFDRSVASGWGSADLGGAWSTPLGASGVSVADGVGSISVGAGVTRQTTLPVTVGDDTSEFSVKLDKVPVGATSQFNYLVRRNATGDYRLKLRYAASGQVNVWITRYLAGGSETLISGDVRLPGFTFTAGTTLKVRLVSEAAGGSTTIRAKVWDASTAQPLAWTVSSTDSTPGLQDPGSIGFQMYAPGGVTNGPLTAKVDDLVVTSTQAVAPQPPNAVVSSSVSGLTAAFDGTGSTANGSATVASYAWDFGDGQTSSAAAPTHRYDTAGTYTVSLVVTDTRGRQSAPATTTVSAVHAAPVAQFAATTNLLAVSVDASASTASDGATLSYAWDFGDGSTASGPTAAHTYATAGARTVTLTVTDSLGSSSVTTQTVTAVEAPVIAADAFGRTVATGWGTADVGGSWSGTQGLSVADGVGTLSTGAGQGRTVTLASSIGDSVSQFAVATDKPATGGGIYVSQFARRTSSGDYRVKLLLSSSGTVTAMLTRVNAGVETTIASRSVTGVSHVAGTPLSVKFATSSDGSATSLRVKVWTAGGAEPSAWLLDSTNNEPSLQGPGQSGFYVYASGSMTNGPVAVKVDDFSVR